MSRKWIIALLFFIIVILGTWISLKQKPFYTAGSTVVIEAVSPDILAIKDIAKSNGTYYSAYKIYMETQREIIKSRRVGHHVIKNLGLKNKESFKAAKDPIGSLLKKLKVDIIKGTGVIRIIAEDEDPEDASRIANEFAVVYVNPSLSLIKANNSRVQDFAGVTLEPVRPNKKLNIAVAIILIIAGGVSLFFFRGPSNIIIKDSNDIAALLQLPVLGSVPKIKPDWKNVKTKADVDRIVEKDSPCMASEAYRSIRAKLLFSLNKSGSIAKSFIITSSAPKEGKTISAINLAIMIARSGENVLLVDAHMKRPRVHDVFNINNDAGFANYLSGEVDFDSIVKYPGIENLSIITSGDTSYRPVESVSSKKQAQYFQR
jgi:succinoglycan biosynthesis transport protein ExoP